MSADSSGDMSSDMSIDCSSTEQFKTSGIPLYSLQSGVVATERLLTGEGGVSTLFRFKPCLGGPREKA